MARDRPSPYDEGGVFYRSAGACPPRVLECADNGEGNPLACAYGIRGPKPYGEGRFSARSAGACPPRALDSADAHDGEGNPLACAYGIRGPKPYEEGRAFLLHRDREGSPTRNYETPSLICN